MTSAYERHAPVNEDAVNVHVSHKVRTNYVLYGLTNQGSYGDGAVVRRFGPVVLT